MNAVFNPSLSISQVGSTVCSSVVFTPTTRSRQNQKVSNPTYRGFNSYSHYL